jgi:hypothetical protein
LPFQADPSTAGGQVHDDLGIEDAGKLVECSVERG